MLSDLAVLRPITGMFTRKAPGAPAPGGDLAGHQVFTREQLERHARELAQLHGPARLGGRQRLIARLRANAATIADCYAVLAAAMAAGQRTPPAAQWLVDNMPLVRAQVAATRRHLPRAYLRHLPRLARGRDEGQLRVHAMVLDFIGHADGRVETETLAGSINAYQVVEALTLGELWAVPIMLRLALIENLARIAERVRAGYEQGRAAEVWATRFVATAERSTADLVLVLGDLARAHPNPGGTFTAELVRRIQGQHTGLAVVVGWLESRLAEHHSGIEATILAETQTQAAEQLSAGITIGSLRTLDETDWREFVEGCSLVERTLRADPDGTYPRQDERTRDRYRHAVERLARAARRSEVAVAESIVALAGGATGEARERHVGHWLIGNGRARAAALLGVARGPLRALAAWAGRHPLVPFLAALAAATAAGALALAWPLLPTLARPAWVALLAVLAALAASQPATALVAWLWARWLRTTALPRLDLSAGLTAEHRTLVVVPTMLREARDAAALAEGLELRWLANPDPNLRFALLTDFGDAPAAEQPGDTALLEAAAAAIGALNRRHAGMGVAPFLLLHRPRLRNPREGVWMGRERKRGKLEDLNELILNQRREAFSRIVGDPEALAGVRYVITLDTDTQLPPGAARTLVATAAHPLNRPRLDPRTRRVVDGYALLQPRVVISTASAARSRFAKLSAPEPGLDSYTGVSADLWQDLAGQGSFVGKGIYDVAAFHAALHGRFPDNAILSHDLIEGCYARSGLVSDVALVEDQPARLLADAARRHRWLRGDWQIAGWALPWARTAAGRARNPLDALARWKIADNLRRALVAPASLALVLWDLVGGSGGLALGALLALWLVTPAIGSLFAVVQRAGEVRWHTHFAVWGQMVLRQLAGIAAWLLFLPFEAWLALHASAVALLRVHVTRRRLLAWQTSGDAERLARADLRGVHRALWACPLAAGALIALVATGSAPAATGLPLALLWAAAPSLAWWLSLPLDRRQQELPAADRAMLDAVARVTWRWFETFVGPEDHWLPPDNVQEAPVAMTAHRTSPTNLGFALLADLAAHDLGYLPVGAWLERAGAALTSMERLERHRGHFYNWYDTVTLAPLPPRYISAVDSGNLAGALSTLAQGLIETESQRAAGPAIHAGLRAAAANLRAACAAAAAAAPHLAKGADELGAELVRRLAAPPAGLVALQRWLDAFAAWAEGAAGAAQALGGEPAWWLAALARQARGHGQELALLAPWSGWRDALPAADAADAARASAAHALAELEAEPSCARIGGDAPAAARLVRALARPGADPAAEAALVALAAALDAAGAAALRRCEQLHQLAARASLLADAMDFACLYDRKRRLLAIGMQVEGERLDRNCYDLLASEARLTSFWAVARGQVPLQHWFALGRPLVASGGQPALMSWSGSMFEYLMPDLLMPVFPDTLLERSNRAVVARQVAYGRSRGVPWGISESGYHLTDAAQVWQYRGFGVPGLGLKRGLGQDLVIAPYASAMALLVDAPAAVANLRRLEREGFTGRYGFYEAIDYTPARLPPGASHGVVRSWMVHHQGMALLAMLHVLADGPMRRRFSADPALKAVALLLQERAPLMAGDAELPDEEQAAHPGEPDQAPSLRVISNPNSPQPEATLLSNGRYHVMLTAAGGGSSRWKEFAVNRWREDAVREADGMFCYLHDVQRGHTWSNTYQPTLRPSRSYEAVFTPARAEFRRRDHDIETLTEIAVSPEDDVELRRVTLINRSGARRTLELTSCAEVVAGSAAADAAHQAFSGLFVQTSVDVQREALLCRRRPRRADEAMPVLVHLMTVHGGQAGPASYETDRMRFIGRERGLAAPAALDQAGPLSGTTGCVLDPVAAIRRRVELGPGESVIVDLVWGMAADPAGAEAIAERYRDRHLAQRVFSLAWSQGRLLLHQLGLTEAQAQAAARLAGALVMPSAFRRAPAGVVALGRRSQPGLWAHGISGDLPIVLLRISDAARLDLVREVLAAHSWWRAMGLPVDLVIWNEDASGYRAALQDQLMGLVAAGPTAALVDRPGGVFVRRSELMPDEDRVLLQAAARLVINDSSGSLQAVAERRPRPERPGERLEPARAALRIEASPPVPAPAGLAFANGLGGFLPGGEEYAVVLEPGRTTPLPWVNVLANPRFGAVVSASGAGYTWADNSHEFRLTPWHGDATTDTSGEALYVRDEDSGRFWSPCPWPARAPARYVVRHGFGFSSFATAYDGVESELTTFVAVEAPVRFLVVRVANRSARVRHLALTMACELALGELRQRGAMHVVSAVDRTTGTLTSRNPYSADFSGRVAFLDASVRARTVTADRGEFLGRNGQWSNPDALARLRLGGRVGACLDPLLAMQVPCELAPGQEREVVFVLGCGGDANEARTLAARWRDLGAAKAELAAVGAHWRRLLGGVRIQSRDPALDLLANGWLLYQVLASRMWGRSGFSQSGGAYGFRDQLQDAMAVGPQAPQLLREQILRAAGRQFTEGDVQHWWHPPVGRGVRTHCSDDLLWLPLAVARYVECSGDLSLLDEQVGFLTGRIPRLEDGDIYELPGAGEAASVYEHCLRAVRHARGRGAHGLPLIGGCDWNDGFDRIGHRGRGESVWLAFFQADVLERLAGLAQRRADPAIAAELRADAAAMVRAAEAHAWDGRWYLRAFTDDGQAIGAAENSECRIDSLPQSWAVLSGVGEPLRARAAMDAVDLQLVRRGRGLVQLFDPPFDHTPLDPGYIRGYPPGVRENGGQYTHAAVWVAMAFARLGDAERAWEVTRLLDPVRRGGDAERLAVSRAEPYVLAADVYGAPPHTGRSGWTWYTGSAGWMYRLLIEELFGLRKSGDRLQVTPCLAKDMDGFRCSWRHGSATYVITVARGAQKTTVDGQDVADHAIALVDDGKEHVVEVWR